MTSTSILKCVITVMAAVFALNEAWKAVTPLSEKQDDARTGSDIMDIYKAVSSVNPYLAEMMNDPVIGLTNDRSQYCQAQYQAASTELTPRHTLLAKLCAFSEATRSVVSDNFLDIAVGRASIHSFYYFDLLDPERQRWTSIGIFKSQVQCEDSQALAAAVNLASMPCRPWRAIPVDTW